MTTTIGGKGLTSALLGGRPFEAGPESRADHVARFGECPTGSAALCDVIARSDLRGRGGAGFPAGFKWRTVAERSEGRAVVVVNGVEADPLSAKDRLLMTTLPHLVLDGAVIAAQSVGASRIVIAINRRFVDARRAIAEAISERNRVARIVVVDVPSRYVAGEESAIVHLVNGGEAKPTLTPPRPFEQGIGARPTLVNNVETLAWAALIARYGDTWYRSLGTPLAPGAVLVTISGAVQRPGVYELPASAGVGEALKAAGTTSLPRAVLIGGYYGLWENATTTRSVGDGAGVLYALPDTACGLAETARMLQYLAAESAQQCGPCFSGLPSLAGVMAKIATGRAKQADVDRLRRWLDQLGGHRGACHHPDGAVRLVRSAMQAFDADVYGHLRSGPCGRSRAAQAMAAPPGEVAWR